MGYQRPCVHGKIMCGALHKGRQILYGTDKVLREHGAAIGKVAQAAAPVVGAMNPAAGIITGGAGKAVEEYARVRNEMGP